MPLNTVLESPGFQTFLALRCQNEFKCGTETEWDSQSAEQKQPILHSSQKLFIKGAPNKFTALSLLCF